MSYNHKIIDQKYHLKGLISEDICNKLIKFYEDHQHMATPEDSYKYNNNLDDNKYEVDNCSFLNISKLRNEKDFDEPYNIIQGGNITMRGVDFKVLGIEVARAISRFLFKYFFSCFLNSFDLF